MNDVSAFERQLEIGFKGLMGPSEPVDDVAILAMVTAADAPTRTFRSIFGATRFVLAAGIVALFGGFLLAGVLTQPSEESVPPVGASPSPEASTRESTALAWERVEVPAALNTGQLDLRSIGTYFVASSWTEPESPVFVSRDGRAWTELDVEGVVIAGFEDTLLVADVAQGGRLSTVRVDGSTAGPESRLPALESMALPPGGSPPAPSAALGPGGVVTISCLDVRCVTSTVWHTADGRTWDRVYETNGEIWGWVTGTSAGFFARTDPGADPAADLDPGYFPIMFSPDGRDWIRIDERDHGRLDLVGSTPAGTILSPRGVPSTRQLFVAKPDGLEPLTLSPDIDERLGEQDPITWAVGHLGILGVLGLDHGVLWSPDGVTWQLEALPDAVPRLFAGDSGSGRSTPHIAGDVVLLPAEACLDPDGSEVDCGGLSVEGHMRVWFRGTTVDASTPPEPPVVRDPEPATTDSDLVPGVELVTEEIEPGVYRVLSDGERDLAIPVAFHRLGGVHKGRIVAAPDGSVWLFGRERFFRLGDPASHASGSNAGVWDVDPDGHVWALRFPDGDEGFAFGCRHIGPPHLVMFDGEQWDGRICNVVDFELDADGVPRVVVELSGPGGPRGSAIGRVRDGNFDAIGVGEPEDWGGMRLVDGFEGFAMSPADPPGDPTILDAGWLIDARGNLYDVQLMTSGTGAGCCHNDAGRVVAVGFASDRSSWAMLKFEVPSLEGDSLESESAYYLARFSPMRPMLPEPEPPASRDREDYPRQLGVYESALNDHGLLAPRLDVAPDGAVWLPSEEGLARFDGETWDWYLPGTYIEDVDIASDGTVWVQANDLRTGPGDPPVEEQAGRTSTYVITPAAVAARATG